MSGDVRLPVPRSLDEVTSAWLSLALGESIEVVSRDRVGTGQVGLSVRFVLAGPANTPASVVVKLPSDDAQSRATGVAMRNYEREVRFYAEVAPTVGIRTPRCWYGDWDSKSGDFVLVLEDLAPATQGDQIEGCSLDHAALALEELAKLHAPRWGDHSLEDLSWLSHRDPQGSAMLQALYQSLWPGFVDIYGPSMTSSQIVLGERLGASLSTWVVDDGVPPTVTHGDYRLDNMLFGDESGGYPLAVVDWQTPGRGVALSDASYFLGAGLLSSERRAHEVDLMREYHGRLVAGGVSAFTWDACWEGYRRYAFSGCVMSVVASMIVGSSDRGIAMFSAMTERHFQHAEDVDAADFLR